MIKGLDAFEASKTYCDDNLYAAKVELTEIYHQIMKSTLRHVYQAKHTVYWFKSTDVKDRALIHRHIISDLTNRGFLIESDIKKGVSITYTISWNLEE